MRVPEGRRGARATRWCEFSSRDMKKLLRIFGTLFAICVVLLASALLLSTIMGRTTWYFRVNGQVTVDGHTTTGYMHTNTERTILLLTRTDQAKPQTYLVALRDGNRITHCGKWHPVRFFPNPVGHENPPCSASDVNPTEVVDAPVEGSLVRGRNSIEFSTVSGKRVKAEW